MKRPNCWTCHDRGFYEVVPDIPKELKEIKDYKSVRPFELMKYIHDNMSKYVHSYLSEQVMYDRPGIYPCHNCHLGGYDDFNQER